MAVLRPGRIDDAGNWLEWDAMARLIEEELPKPVDPEDPGRLGRRQFLIAIATGVIEYLRQHQHDAFVTHTDVSGSDHTGSLEIL